MPRLSVWFIRTALLYLTLGATLGGLLLIHKGIPLHPSLWGVLPSHMEFVLFGWMIQLVMGVAFWILPRFAEHPKRGNLTLAWAAYILVNAGLWLAALASVYNTGGWMHLAGRSLQAAGILAFGLHAWPRIKPL